MAIIIVNLRVMKVAFYRKLGLAAFVVGAMAVGLSAGAEEKDVYNYEAQRAAPARSPI